MYINDNVSSVSDTRYTQKKNLISPNRSLTYEHPPPPTQPPTSAGNSSSASYFSSKISAFTTPLPLGISNDLLWGKCDTFWNHTVVALLYNNLLIYDYKNFQDPYLYNQHYAKPKLIKIVLE